MSLMTDLKYALRSFGRAKGLAITVVVTLALGIGANAAIFSVVRGVLLRPLVNRDPDSLIYIRQTAKGVGMKEICVVPANEPAIALSSVITSNAGSNGSILPRAAVSVDVAAIGSSATRTARVDFGSGSWATGA